MERSAIRDPLSPDFALRRRWTADPCGGGAGPVQGWVTYLRGVLLLPTILGHGT
jgi:hypothetical protein